MSSGGLNHSPFDQQFISGVDTVIKQAVQALNLIDFDIVSDRELPQRLTKLNSWITSPFEFGVLRIATAIGPSRAGT